MAAGSIVVDLLMKTGSFETDTKRAQKSLKNFEKSVDDFAVKVGTGVAVAGAALSAMVLNTTRAAEEINRFAQLSGATTESFQMMAAGASTVGIQTDKLADIFKDVQDKVGDFMQTGGGALADFFENIAPKVGVTAEQFRKLSGPQALQLYVSSLEKANLSQSDMIFYLEAIASDSSLLLPLMRDNGKAMQAFGEQAKASGQIMSDDLIKNSVEFRRQMEQLTGILKGFAKAVTALVLPTLIRFSIEFRTAMENANGFFDAIGKFGTINPFRSDTENLKIYRGELEKLNKFREQQVERGGLFGSTAAVDKDIEDVEAKIKYLETLQQRLFAANPTAGAGRGFVNPASVVGPAPSLGTSATDKKANEAALEERKKFDEEMQKFEQAEFNRKLEITQLRLDEELEKERQYQEMLTEYSAAEEENRRKVHEARLIAQEEADKGYWGRWLEAAESAMMSFNDLSAAVISNFTGRMGDAFEKMVFDGQNLKESFKSMAESMARSVINALGQMAAQWLAYQAVQLLVGKTTQASSSAAKTFEAMSAQQMAAIHAFSSTAAIPIYGPIAAPGAAVAALAATAPFVATIASLNAAAVGARATGGPVSADAPYLVGERGPELFVPNTAGRIIPNNQMSGDSGVVVQQTINVTTGIQQTVRAEIMSLMPQIANAAKSAVADARQRGGSYANAMR